MKTAQIRVPPPSARGMKRLRDANKKLSISPLPCLTVDGGDLKILHLLEREYLSLVALPVDDHGR